MKRALLTSLAVLVLLLAGGLLTASGDAGDATGPSGISIFGTYTLQTIDGTSLPFVVIQVANDKIEITAGSVQINSDNPYSVSLTARVTEAGTVTTETKTITGTFSMTGSDIQFSDQGDGNGPFTGSISGNTLTIIEDGDSLVFRM